jgi:hypothetical protein
MWEEAMRTSVSNVLCYVGVWTLTNSETGLAVVNHFNVEEVAICFVHWEATSVNLELWSQERPVSVDSPIKISHYYSVKQISAA